MKATDRGISRNADLLEANEAVLRRRFPELRGIVDACREQWSKSIRAHSTRSGMPTISVVDGHATVHVHSTFEPVVEAERWVRDPASQDWDFAVVFGIGLGYHLEALLERKPQCRLVVVEPRPDVFCAALALKDQRAWLTHPYLKLIVSDDSAAAAQELFSVHMKELLDGAPFFVWPAATRYAPDYWGRFKTQLVDMVRSFRADTATRLLFSKQWIDNFFQNLPVAISDPGVLSLKGRLSGRPAIIVAAGPSLEKNVHLLHDVNGKAVIIAAGSAINPLLKNGIEPDLLVSYDGSEANYRHFENLRTPRVPLVYAPIIFPRIIEEYQGPRFTAAMDAYPFIGWFFDSVAEKKGSLSSGPSVANVAWHLANVLELNPIILVGQDLAFTDGKTHADGAVHARTVDLESGSGNTQYVTTEGIDGTPVVTSLSMYSMKVWFEQRLTNPSFTSVTIDATEGGAKIAGTVVMSLKEALDKYCRNAFDPRETIMSVHHAESHRLRGADLDLSIVYHGLTEQIEAVERLTTRGLKDADRLLRESNTKHLTDQRLNEAYKRLDRHYTRLVRTHVFKLFIEPVIGNVSRSIALRIEARQEKETDLFVIGAEAARQYVTLFASARDMARHVARLVRDRAGAG